MTIKLFNVNGGGVRRIFKDPTVSTMTRCLVLLPDGFVVSSYPEKSGAARIVKHGLRLAP